MEDSKVVQGHWKARAILGTEQYGFSGDKDTPQIGINMRIEGSLGSFDMTTILFCSPEAWPYTVQRLQLMGWKGKSAKDLEDLSTLTNEVEVDVSSDNYQGRQQWRCQIATGPGVISFAKTTDRASFASRISMLLGNTSGGGGGVPGGGDEIPF